MYEAYCYSINEFHLHGLIYASISYIIGHDTLAYIINEIVMKVGHRERETVREKGRKGWVYM